MGIFDKIKGAIFEEEKVPDEVDATKPLAPQMNNVGSNVPFSQPQPTWTGGQVATPTWNAQPQLSPEDTEKWQNYCKDILVKLRADNAIYDEFMKNLEGMASFIQDTNALFAASAVSMKNKGISRDQLIAAFQKVVDGVNEAQQVFIQDIEKRTATGLQAPTDDIHKKEQEIVSLQQQIQELQNTIAENNKKIETRKIGFNTFYGNVVSTANINLQNIQKIPA